MVKILRKTLLRSSKSENDDEKYHHELFRHSGRIESEEVEPTMKKMKDLGEKHLTDEKFILTSNLEKNLRVTPGKEKSQVRSWEETYGLGPTQKINR